jgi:hypothetical protein
MLYSVSGWCKFEAKEKINNARFTFTLDIEEWID